MEGFVDIHTHILPGIDDGARDLSEARDMIRMACENGTRAMILTPHCFGRYDKNSVIQIREAFASVLKMAESEFPELKLYPGSEVHYESAVPDRLAEGAIQTLNGSHYVLVEFGGRCLRSQVLRAVSSVVYSGHTPVIAHVERYDVFRRDAELINEVLELGALLQVNAESILGSQGFRIKHFCHRLLRRGQVHFVASDGHHMNHRKPQLRQCWKKVSKKYGSEYASRVFRENALAVIADAEL